MKFSVLNICISKNKINTFIIVTEFPFPNLYKQVFSTTKMNITDGNYQKIMLAFITIDL